MSDAFVIDQTSAGAVAEPCRGSESCTEGVRVRVTPTYQPDHSDPFERRFIFSYTIRVTNESDAPARLLTRRWIIINAHGDRHEVDGEGVVGRQPLLQPGESFEYQSYCPLTTPWGTMEGSYGFVSDDGHRFEATIARFYLVAHDQD